MVYQDATGLYHFVINVIPFISNSVYAYEYEYIYLHCKVMGSNINIR